MPKREKKLYFLIPFKPQYNYKYLNTIEYLITKDRH